MNYLAKVYRYYQNLQNEKNKKLKVIFVSIDPQRDKPDSIKKYLKLFNSEFIGLTGKDENDKNYREMK